VLLATRSLGSYPVIRQLVAVKQLLEPHRGVEGVGDFLEHLADALRERTWLGQSPT